MLAFTYAICQHIRQSLYQASRFAVSVLLVAVATSQAAWAQFSVAAGAALYTTSKDWDGPISAGGSFNCALCHFQSIPATPNIDGQTVAGYPNSRHISASNNAAMLVAAFQAGGRMVGQAGQSAFTMTASDAYNLSLYIGQYTAPAPVNTTIVTRSGVAGVRDVYALLARDSALPVYPTKPTPVSGVAQAGGVTVTASGQGVTPTVNVTSNTLPIAYNITYTPLAGYVGGDSFTYNLKNIVSPLGVTSTVTVTVYGVSNAALTASVIQGVNSPSVFTITSNDPGVAKTFTATGLPAGLSIPNPANGVISGIATAPPGVYAVQIGVNVVSAGANNGPSATKTLNITVAGISSSATFTRAQNAAMAPFNVTAIPAAGATYSVIAGALPPGLTLNPSGVNAGQITGTPTVSGSFGYTVQAVTSAGNVSLAMTTTITSAGKPVITTTPSLPASPAIAGTVGSLFTATQVNASNPPINVGSYVVSSGALPGGLSLNANTGQITGTPSVSGDFNFTLQATNSSGNSTAASNTIRIAPNAAPAVTSAATASTNINNSGFTYQITATNPVFSGYSVIAGSLPTGLNLNTGTGLVSGTPTVSGVFNATLQATNSVGSGNLPVAFTINPTAVPVISAPTAATVGSLGAITPIQVVASNPVILGYALGTGSSLPAGLSLNSANGQITGTPTTPGVVNTTLTASNAAGPSAGAVVVFTVDGITSSGNVNATQGVLMTPYQLQTVVAASAAYAQTAGALPAGMSFSTVTGQITGTPTVSGNFSVTLQATTSTGTYSKVVNISVASAGAPVISSTPVLSTNVLAPTVIGNTGSAISPIQINASNPPITVGSYTATGLPAGLSVNANTGQITGTPSASGDFAVTLGASNASGPNTLSVNVRVNSNAAPVITSGASGNSLTINVAAGTAYQIVATNGPITGYAVVGPSVLPAGLSLNTGTGLVSGTPTTSGIFSTTLSATNSGGLTGTQVVSFTVNAAGAPVITSPTFASLAVGVAINPIQVVATNAPIQSYGVQSGSALPTGLTIDPITGVISGKPTVPGPVTTVLTATNLIGVGNLAVSFNVGVPVPTACVMTVLSNTPTSLDLKACMFPTTSPTGVSVLSPPQHGTVSVAGTVVTFTPVPDYFGPDTFTAVGYFAGGGVSAAGTVAITIPDRPNLALNPTLRAIVGAQSDTAQRFSSAQARNFQRRAESLHQRPPAAGGAGTPNLQFRAPAVTTESRGLAGAAAEVVANDTLPAQGPTAIPAQAPSGTVPSANFAPRFDPSRDPFATVVPSQISTAQGLDAVASGIGLKSLPFAGAVASLLTTKSVNLAQLVPSNGAPKTGETSFWVEGVVSFGKQDIPGTAGAVEFSTNGVSAGADRRINDQLILGLGVGFGRDKTTIGTDGSQNDGSGTTLALYGSYQPQPGTFIDGMLGIGSLDFDTRRYVAPINAFALGKRKGTQWFGSITAGYEFNNNNILFSPYARLDYSSDTLQDSVESGVGAFAVAYLAQTNTSLQGTLGARAESIHLTSFGWAIPRIRAEYRHEFQSDRLSFFSYADQIGGPRYAINTLGSGRDGLVLGIGTDFVLRDGWTFGLDYQLNQSSAQDSSYALKFKITKDLDAKGLPKLVANYEDNPSKPIDVQVDAAYVFDDNVTRAKAGPDVMFDSAFVVNVSKTELYSLSEQSRFVLTGNLGGERFQNFNGLSNVTATVEGELQYRDSAEFDAPTFGLFGKLSAQRFQSDIRNGYRATLGLSMRQPLTDKITLFGALSRNTRNAVSDVFSTQDTALRLNADYLFSDRLTVYATGEWRYGDIVSSGRPSLENISIAKVFRQDDAYPGGQFFAYKVEGQTVLATLGVNYGFGPRDSLDFSWRMVTSTPSLRPAFVTSPQSYIANQLSLTYLVRF